MSKTRLDTHEKICTERYGNIWDALKDIKADMQADRVARATLDKAVHDRFNAISGRMWAAVAGALIVTLGAFGALAFYLLTKSSR